MKSLVLRQVDVEQRGVIEHFDDAAGLGTLVDEAGEAIHFHCTQIADGSRTIAEGTAVFFVLRRVNLGAIEASGIRPVAWEGSGPVCRL